jgi:hypothetical protein
MNTKHKLLSTIAAVSLALGMSLLPGGVASAAGSNVLHSTGSVRTTDQCNGPSQPIVSRFGHAGVMLCGSNAVGVNFGGGNVEDVVIGVLGNTRPIYADGGSGWHRVGNGVAYHENTCHYPADIGLYPLAGYKIGVIGTDNHWYEVTAFADSSFSNWTQYGTMAC